MAPCCHLLILLRALDVVLLTAPASQVDTTMDFAEKIHLDDALQTVWVRKDIDD